jgi:hypothetical protein
MPMPFVLPEFSFLEVEVRRNDAGDTFVTDLQCSRNGCGKTVVIDSDGPKTVQNVSCLHHGLLTTFPDQTALGEFVRISANEILARNGHELIEPGAVSIFGDEQPPADLMN